MKRIFLLAIAIALMTIGSASAQRVRVNNFTPFGIRPDVVVRGNNFGHNNAVIVRPGFNGSSVFINSFGGFNTRRSTVFVNPFFTPTVVFPPASPVIVDPTAIYGLNPFGVGYGGYSYGSFGTGHCGW